MFFSCRKSSGIAEMDGYAERMDDHGRTRQTPIDGMSADIERVTYHRITASPYRAGYAVSGEDAMSGKTCRIGQPYRS